MAATQWRQFAVVLQKNLILQIRDRRSLFGISGWGALLLQVLLPVAFFSLMCIPKYFIQPYQHPILLQPQDYDVDTNWWAGATPYEGPAAAGGGAQVVFVPDTLEVSSLLHRLAMAVACPEQPYKRMCSSGRITSFACLFGVQQAPADVCKDPVACMTTPACYQPALLNHFQMMPTEAAALELLQAQPHSVDAVVVFPQAATAAAAANATADTATTTATAKQTWDSIPHSSGNSRAGAAGASGDNLLLDYLIRMNSSDVPPTQFLQDLFDVSPGIMPLPGNMLWEYRHYWFFINLQLAIDRALLGGQQSSGSYPARLNLRVKPFPWPAKQEDLGAASAAAFFNLLLVFAFLAPTRSVVGSIVREKELRLREGMRILGLQASAYWASWSLTHWLTLAASGLLCAVVGLYPFHHSSLAIMLLFYLLFSAALISFSYFLSTLFTTSRVAGTATQFIYALSMMPGFLLPFVRPYGGLSWYIASLSPPSAASLFAAALVNWERLASGITRATLTLPVTPGSNFSVASVMWLLLLDVFVYAALTWYCDKVMPSAYGQVLQPWFFLQASYWRSRQAHSSSSSSTPSPDDGCSPSADPAAAAFVDVVNLRKVFRGPGCVQRVAVQGLNLKMASGRITALLGHNGAGKTTCIHMLTGMVQPTSGTAVIGGADIRTNMHLARRSLGICPQFDILWPDISVQEHLVLYAVIKGATWAGAASVAREAAAEVGLSDKLSCLASELSGGQRRKLSVAIAFLGSPAVVFLDEPTSGMDPYSRRATWDVIRRRRASSVIVLTTHSMEEADLLCDDIHILVEGNLAASGTPLQLKAQYGVGYTLTVVMDQANSSDSTPVVGGVETLGTAGLQHRQPLNTTTSRSQPHTPSAANAVLQLVSSHVPSAVLLSAAGAEVAIQLPKEHSTAFSDMLRTLEASAGSLGVASYGLSVTTLEEVFLSIADQACRLPQQTRSGAQQDTVDTEGLSRRPETDDVLVSVTQADQSQQQHSQEQPYVAPDGPALLIGLPLFLQQFRALFMKRALCARRDRLAVLTQFVVPLLLVLLAMAASSLETSRSQQPPLLMSRQRCLMAKPALLAAAPAVRQQVEYRGFMDGYPRPSIVDTPYTNLYRGSSGPALNLTLEGQLLSQWDLGCPHYDALFIQQMPPLEQLLTSLGEPPAITLLVNQSAVSGLPTALNQATTALLRVLVAAGGDRHNQAHYMQATATHFLTEQPKPEQAEPLLTQHWPGPSNATEALQQMSEGLAQGAAVDGNPSVPCLPSCLPTISVSSSPFPLLPGQATARVRQDAGALMLVLCMTMAASVLSASFVVFLVREKENNFKFLQVVSGTRPAAYWLSNFCWDLLSFSLTAAGIIMLVGLYDQPQLAGARLAAISVLLMVFGAAGIACTYLLHFLFQDEMRALQRLNTAYFLLGYLGFTTTWVLGLVARVLGKPTLAATASHVKGLLRLVSPHFTFAQGLYDITSTYQGDGDVPIPGLQPQATSNPFSYEVLGVAVIHMMIQTLVFAAITLLLDAHVLQLLREGGPGRGDADVEAEKEAVIAGAGMNAAMVVLNGVRKSYFQGYGRPPVAAVAGLWLRVWPGECFGLLGVNGAGKTTTFRMLTGEVMPDAGDAFIAGHSVLMQLAYARQRLGYCPQFEALPTSMTGREVLHMFARLRGVVQQEQVASMTQVLLEQLGLLGLADVVCGAYSGGNKRKLSVAIALVGDPPLVLLDEPSTGMDPAARHALWKVVHSHVLAAGRTIILTSHSMEEVEALANRLIIMSAGTACCCGTPQHLKSRFGDGYTLEVRLAAQGLSEDADINSPTSTLDRAEHYLLAAMPGAYIIERQPEMLVFHLPIDIGSNTQKHGQQDLSLPVVFELVEASRQALGITEYSLSQSSLERVFLSLARVAAQAADE